MNKEWTYQELEILRRDFPVLPCAELARKLGRTMHAVYCKAFKLGIGKGHSGNVWTKRNLKLLTDFYPIMFNKPLAKWIGVSPSSLHRKARALGLTKRPGFLEDRRKEIVELARTALKKAYRDGRPTSAFKKGERNYPAGEFKKGQVESPETKARRSASLKASWEKRKKQEKFRKDYNINNN